MTTSRRLRAWCPKEPLPWVEDEGPVGAADEVARGPGALAPVVFFVVAKAKLSVEEAELAHHRAPQHQAEAVGGGHRGDAGQAGEVERVALERGDGRGLSEVGYRAHRGVVVAAPTEQAELADDREHDVIRTWLANGAAQPAGEGSLQADLAVLGGVLLDHPVETAQVMLLRSVAAAQPSLPDEKLLQLGSQGAVEAGVHQGSGRQTSRSRSVATLAYTEIDRESSWPRMSLTSFGGAAAAIWREA